jgi:hypothetical protein
LSMKNPNNTIGNRTRDLPNCNTVPQPIAPSRPPHSITIDYIHFSLSDCNEAKGQMLQCLQQISILFRICGSNFTIISVMLPLL